MWFLRSYDSDVVVRLKVLLLFLHCRLFALLQHQHPVLSYWCVWGACSGRKSRCFCRWYKLRSKPGKKEKERGEIEVDIQFMRSNLTASMFDLSMKDKARSPFGKLKDKLKGKRSSGLSDTASAIVPSTTHSPADSEDEASEKEKKKSKFKTLFSKPGLQKTSLSQSLSVLPTPQPVAAGVRLRPRDFQPQWDDEDLETSPTSEREYAPCMHGAVLRATESLRRLSWRGPLKAIWSNSPAMNGDTRAPSGCSEPHPA